MSACLQKLTRICIHVYARIKQRLSQNKCNPLI